MRIRDAADLECGGLTPLWLRRSRFRSVFDNLATRNEEKILKAASGKAPG
jgi:hypothetical protein